MTQLVLMICFVISATLEALTEFSQVGSAIYAVVLAIIFILAIKSLTQTFSTHPGEVTQQLIDRLKSQLMHPKQTEHLYDIHGTKPRLEYQLKCLNRAIMRHIQMTQEQAPSQFVIRQNEEDIEMLDMQGRLDAKTKQRLQEDGKQVPQVCKFSYCEPCGKIMPPRVEHCTVGCDSCILRVDSHFTMMGNCCIGFLNHKFFLLYLTYFTLGCFLTTLPFTEQCLFMDKGFLELIELNWTGTMTFLISGCLFFGILCFFLFQMRFLLMNQTTHEFGISAKLKPFKHRFWTKNVAVVFGQRKRDWLNPWVHPFTEDVATQHNEFISAIIPTVKFNF